MFTTFVIPFMCWITQWVKHLCANEMLRAWEMAVNIMDTVLSQQNSHSSEGDQSKAESKLSGITYVSKWNWEHSGQAPLSCHQCRTMRTQGHSSRNRSHRAFPQGVWGKIWRPVAHSAWRGVGPEYWGRSPSPPASSNSREPCKAKASLRNSVGIRQFSAGERQRD